MWHTNLVHCKEESCRRGDLPLQTYVSVGLRRRRTHTVTHTHPQTHTHTHTHTHTDIITGLHACKWNMGCQNTAIVCLIILCLSWLLITLQWCVIIVINGAFETLTLKTIYSEL